MAINNTVNFKPISNSFKSAVSSYKVNPNYQAPTSLNTTQTPTIKKAPVTVANSTTAPKVTPTATYNAQPTVAPQTTTQHTPVKGIIPAPQYSSLVKNITSASTPSTQQNGLVSNLQNASKPNSTQTGLVNRLQDTAQGNVQLGQDAKNIADFYAPQIARIGQLGAGAVAGDLSTGSNVVGSGNAAIASQSASSRMSALGQAEQAQLQGNQQQLNAQNQIANTYNQALGGANTQQSQQLGGLGQALQGSTALQQNQLSGLGTAAGYAQPVQVPFGNQYIDPTTGQPISGGGQGGSALGQLPPQGQEAVNSYAQAVREGRMTRQDAESRLGTYSIAGINALNEALGQDFNTNASNASAQTTATGQQVQTAADSTNQALDTLGNLFTSLPEWQTGGIPLTNNLAQWIGKQVGSQALQQYKTNLADARSQLIGVLNSSGGTPTGNESTANQYLPDNMTKAQFDANVGTAQNPGIVRQLIAQKVGSFMQSGAQQGQQGGTIVQTSAGAINTNW